MSVRHIILATLIAVLGVSCASPELKELRRQAAALPASIARADLYEKFPPKRELPEEGFLWSTGGVVLGSETFALDDEHLLTGDVRYQHGFDQEAAQQMLESGEPLRIERSEFDIFSQITIGRVR